MIAEQVNKSLRLALLRLLSEPELNYKANTAVLHSAVGDFGFQVGRDRITSQCDLLADIGLVTQEDLGPVRVITITARGLDVAAGRLSVTGVDRPTPKG